MEKRRVQIDRNKNMDMTVKLQVFEGPLDLLLHLLDKKKVNIVNEK